MKTLLSPKDNRWVTVQVCVRVFVSERVPIYKHSFDWHTSLLDVFDLVDLVFHLQLFVGT